MIKCLNFETFADEVSILIKYEDIFRQMQQIEQFEMENRVCDDTNTKIPGPELKQNKSL